MEHDLEKELNMKLLCIFGQLSGLKINSHTNKKYFFGKAKDIEQEYKILFGCDTCSLPFRYLGIPIHFPKFKSVE
jgi:hypothetical protein